MFFNQPLAAKSANGSLWCGEIRKKARTFLFQTNESSVARSLSLSQRFYLSPFPCSTCSLSYAAPTTAAFSSCRRSFLPSSSLSRCLVLICCMRRLRLRTAKCDGARPWRRTGDSLQKRRIQLKDVAGKKYADKKEKKKSK